PRPPGAIKRPEPAFARKCRTSKPPPRKSAKRSSKAAKPNPAASPASNLLHRSHRRFKPLSNGRLQSQLRPRSIPNSFAPPRFAHWALFGHWSLGIRHTFVIRHSSFVISRRVLRSHDVTSPMPPKYLFDLS